MTLTREEILAMGPGQELSELVAIHVMGWEKETFGSGTVRWYEIKDGVYTHSPKGGDWNPSTDISAAWEVEEQLKELRLHTGYVSALKQVLVSTCEYVGMFDYIHATAEQRCKSALLTVLNL